jgi:outer membrane autotransporter protein
MTKNIKKLTLSVATSALLAGNAFAQIAYQPNPPVTIFGAIHSGFYTTGGYGALQLFNTADISKVKTIYSSYGGLAVFAPQVNNLYLTNDSGLIVKYDLTNNLNNLGSVGSTDLYYGNYHISSSISSDGTKVYATSSNGLVNVIDTQNLNILATITAGTNPGALTFTPDGSNVYVANYGSNTVSVINTLTNNIANTINVGTNPIGIVSNSDGNLVYVLNNGSNNISIINTTTNSVVNTISVGNTPTALVLSKDGTKLYVAHDNGNGVNVYNTSTGSLIQNIPIVAPDDYDGNNEAKNLQSISISPDGTKLYITGLSRGGQSTGTFTGIIDTSNYTVTEITNSISSSWGANNSNFISTNLITGTLEVPNIEYLKAEGFDNYVNFAGGTLKATGSFTLSNPVYLHDAFNITWDDSSTFTTVAGGTVDTNGYDVTFSGEVSGVGSLTKTGNGVLTLNANNTYTGNTNVNAGTLAVTADTSSSNFIVNNSGILSGNGTVGNTTVKNGGVIYPTGTSTLNVDGNLSFENGSIYRLNANRLAQSGKIAVSGTATLDGNVEVKADNNGTWNTSTNYEILSANSISGTYDGVSSDLAFLTPTLQYTQAGKVNLTLARNDVTNEEIITQPTTPTTPVVPTTPTTPTTPTEETTTPTTPTTPIEEVVTPTPTPTEETPTQVVTTPTKDLSIYDKELLPVAKALDKADEQNVSSMQDLFTVIEGMNTTQAKDAYRQLLGTSLNNTHTISNSLSTFNTNLFDRLSKINTIGITGTNSGDENETLIGSDNGKYNFWSRVLGGASKLNGDTLRSKVSSNSSGIQLGAEKISDDVVFGTSLAYITSDIDFKNDETKSDLDTYILGLYAQKTFNNVFVNAEVNVGQNKTQTSRTTPTNTAFSEPKSNTITTGLEVGYKFDLSNQLYLKPSIIGGYTHLTQDAYNETGAGGANLSIDKYNTNSSNLGVSLKTQKVFTQNNKDFADVEFGIGYVEEFGDTNKALNATFASAPNTGNFEIRGVDKDTNKYIASISTNYYLSSTSSLFASVNGAKNSDEESINGVLGVKIGF